MTPRLAFRYRVGGAAPKWRGCALMDDRSYERPVYRFVSLASPRQQEQSRRPLGRRLV